MTDLEKMIGNEVKELKTLYDMSEAEYDRRSEEGENIDLIDYVSDVLDTEYILDSNFTLIGARLYITLGGPTIYVDTHDNEVVGHFLYRPWIHSECLSTDHSSCGKLTSNRYHKPSGPVP